MPSTPWLWEYWPVNRVERDGQQSGLDTKERSKVVPRSPSVRRTPDITRIDSSVWSSVITITMFGRFGGRSRSG